MSCSDRTDTEFNEIETVSEDASQQLVSTDFNEIETVRGDASKELAFIADGDEVSTCEHSIKQTWRMSEDFAILDYDLTLDPALA